MRLMGHVARRVHKSRIYDFGGEKLRRGGLEWQGVKKNLKIWLDLKGKRWGFWIGLTWLRISIVNTAKECGLQLIEKNLLVVSEEFVL